MAKIKAPKVKLRDDYEKWHGGTVTTLVKGDPVTLVEERLYFSGDPVGHAYYKVKAKGFTGYVRKDAVNVEEKDG